MNEGSGAADTTPMPPAKLYQNQPSYEDPGSLRPQAPQGYCPTPPAGFAPLAGTEGGCAPLPTTAEEGTYTPAYAPYGYGAWEPQAAPIKAPPTVFTPREWLSVALALVLGILWFVVFSHEALLEGGLSLPGLGIPVFVIAFFASLISLLGRRVRLSPAHIALLVGIGLLSLVPAIYGDLWLRTADCFLLAGLCLTEVLLLSGFAEKAWCHLSTIGRAIAFGTASSFRHIPKPFKAAGGLHAKGAVKAGGVAIGLLVAAGLLVVVLPLLISADSVFGGYFADFRTWLSSLKPFDMAWKAIRVIAIALMLSSLFYAALHQDGKRWGIQAGVGGQAQAAAGPKAPLVPLVTALVAIDVVYALFVVVQFAFLFGGTEASAISGGYAQYARSGFFQLVAVAVINLAIVLSVTRLANAAAARNPVLVACEMFLVLCTAVILVSAYWRMSLYISVYGLSLLRALTLLGMAFIAVCLAAAAIKVLRQDFAFFRVFFTAGIALWIAFNFLNVDARIAEYNVDGYLAGRIDQVDVGYLASLSPDTMPALEGLAAERPSYAAEVESWEGHYQRVSATVPWYKESLCYTHIEGQ